MDSEITFACPTCKSLLIRSTDDLHCQECQIQWPIVDDIPQFTATYSYWGEISQHTMQLVNQEIETENWNQVLRRHLSASGLIDKYEFITDLNRANWHLFLPLTQDAKILDIGCGLGTISHALADHYRSIAAVETVPERLYFSKARFKQEGITNVQLVRASLLDLPFPNDSFDLVVLNGVLEWVGLADHDRKPPELQLTVLSRIRELLKENGILYIGIENRAGISYFLGRIDHNDLKYTSLLPRKLASFITRRKKNEDYRTYTYTHRGYRRLLRQGGFQNLQFYYPVPGYNEPRFILKLEKESLQYFLSRQMLSKYAKKRVKYLLIRAVVLSGLYKWLVADYIIFAQKENLEIENRILAYFRNNPSKFGLQKSQIEALSLFGNNNASFISFVVLQRGKALFHVKIRKASRTDGSLHREQDNLRFVQNRLNGRLEGSISRFCFLEHVDGYDLLIQDSLPGHRLIELLQHRRYPNSRKELKFLFEKLEQAKDWLVEFHKSVDSGNLKITGHEFENKFIGPLRQLAKKLSVDDTSAKIDRIRRQAESLLGSSIPRFPQHGDFCDCNILIDEKRFYVIDWENYAQAELPLFDIFHVLTTSMLSYFSLQRANGCDTFKRIYFERSEVTGFINDYLMDYCESLKIPREFIKLGLPLYLATFHKMFSSKVTTSPSYLDYLQVYFQEQDALVLT